MKTEYEIDFSEGFGFYLVACITGDEASAYTEYKHKTNWPTAKIDLIEKTIRL